MADGGLTLGAVGFGLAAGFVGWVATEFFAKPFRRGFDLIAEARTRVVLFANVSGRANETKANNIIFVDLPEAEERRLLEAERSYREMGATMNAFARTERLAAFVLKRAGFDFKKISTAFISLSNTVGRYGDMRHHSTQMVEKSLKMQEE